MPTLAELRARTGTPPRPKATQTVTLIEGQHLLDESRRLHEEYVDLLATQPSGVNEEGRTGPPRKAGAKSDPRLAEIEEALSTRVERLAEYQGQVGIEGWDGGAWQRWKDEHPPRPDNQADMKLTGGTCDSTALFNSLGVFVKTWNGETLVDGDWDGWLADSITYADRRDLVVTVVAIHEDRLIRSPFSSSGSSGTPPSETD